MDDLAKEYLISFYSKNLLMHGDRPEALGWTKAGQLSRYSLMLGAGDLKGKKVLDYGCGKGDFYGFLREKGIEAEYTGFDITPGLIQLARNKYPGIRFEVFDAEERDLDEEFDYVFLCGVFNNRVEGVEDAVKNVLKRLFDSTRLALAFNCLTSHAAQKDIGLNYMDPGDLLGFALKNLSPHVALHHCLIADDLTLFVHKKISASHLRLS